MAKKTARKKETTLSLRIPDTEIRRHIPFNRFQCKVVDDHVLCAFGFVDGGYELAAALIAMQVGDLANSWRSTDRYIESLDSIEAASLKSWSWPDANVESSNYLVVANGGAGGELLFTSFPVSRVAHELKAKKTEVAANAIGIALLRSTIELHKRVLLELRKRLPAAK